MSGTNKENGKMVLLINFLCLLIGSIAGAISGLTGVSGGVVVLPALTALFHLEHLTVTVQALVATSVSTLAIMSLTSRLSVKGPYEPLISSHEGWLILSCGAVGLFVPDVVRTLTLDDLHRGYLMVMVLSLALQLGCQWVPAHKRLLPLWVLIPCSCCCALVGGSVGVGGALLSLPLFQLMGMQPQQAVALSGVVSLTGLMGSSLGFILWNADGLANANLIHGQVMALLLIAGIPTAVLCRRVSRSVSPQRHRQMLVGALAAITLATVTLRHV